MIFSRRTIIIFVIDYICRLFTADLKFPKHGKSAFVVYPFTFMALIDLLSILPSFGFFNQGLKILKVFRLIRTFKVLKALMFLCYSKSVDIIVGVVKAQKEPLLTVAGLAIGYILISALVTFNVEPESFESFFDTVYWVCVSLTTVGYGDIYPVSVAGRIITMISSIMGIAIVALPSGIITAGYLDKLLASRTTDSDETKK